MPIDFPIVPNAPGVPALAQFSGNADIAGSIAGNVLTITSGIGAIAPGLALSGVGIADGTVLTSGLLDLQDGIGTAAVNVAQTVPALGMTVSGSLDGLLPDEGDVMSADSIEAVVGAGSAARWGIFLNGEAVIVPDSIISLDFKKDWHIADYPVEQGNFESYNKVRIPYDARVGMVIGGTESQRGDFLETLDEIADSLDLYDIVTPEITYSNANIVHYDYRRTSENGVSLLQVVVWLQEVRLEATSEFVSTAAPSAVDQVNAGVVQAQPASAQEAAEFKSHGATGSW